MCVYNLPPNYTDASVRAMFSVFGAVADVSMSAADDGNAYADNMGSMRATVTFADATTAQLAHQTMNNFVVANHKLRCVLRQAGSRPY